MTLTKENFHEYLAALESVDGEVLATRFYHRDFSIEMGGETLDLAGLLDFEKSLKSLVDFHFDVKQLIVDEAGIAMDAIESFHVLRDAEVPVVGPARKGERWDLHLIVLYTLRDGRISNIKPNIVSVTKAAP